MLVVWSLAGPLGELDTHLPWLAPVGPSQAQVHLSCFRLGPSHLRGTEAQLAFNAAVTKGSNASSLLLLVVSTWEERVYPPLYAELTALRIPVWSKQSVPPGD
jgi:hypothetical protein